jgi:uncharacterized protein
MTMSKELKLFYASDIHGSEKCFGKFLNAGKFYRAQVLIMGGDITGKAVVPLILERNRYTGRFMGRDVHAATGAEVAELEKNIRMSGFYPVRLTPEEHKRYQQDEQALKALIKDLILDSTKRWIEMAESRLKGAGIRCFVHTGNDDEPYVDEALRQSTIIENRDGELVNLDDDQEMLVVGYSNKTPFNSPREMEETQLEDYIRELARRLSRPTTAVFTLHVPPYGSGLDNAPALEDMKVVTRGGEPVMVPVGSTAVRKVIEEFQPLLGLHGHVHESRGVKKIGATVCLNPGSEYSEGVLRGALVTLERSKVKSYQLVRA